MSAGARILQFGRTGQLGRELIRCAARLEMPLQSVAREEADFTNPHDVANVVMQIPDIDIVVNAVGYTAVDKAESDETLAMTINADTVGVLARACAARDIPLIHVSTDYVYDGEKPEPYLETDATNPLGVYGRTKLAGEAAVRESGARHVILRTSWVYSPFGANFVKTMLRLGAEREELRVVDDQHGAPTSAGDLAEAILAIVMRLRSDPTSTENFGVFHYTGAGATTWCGFTRAIIDASRDWASIKARVSPIATVEYPTPARRPRNSRLDCKKIGAVYGIQPQSWRKSLSEVLADLEVQKESIS